MMDPAKRQPATVRLPAQSANRATKKHAFSLPPSDVCRLLSLGFILMRWQAVQRSDTASLESGFGIR